MCICLKTLWKRKDVVLPERATGHMAGLAQRRRITVLRSAKQAGISHRHCVHGRFQLAAGTFQRGSISNLGIVKAGPKGVNVVLKSPIAMPLLAE